MRFAHYKSKSPISWCFISFVEKQKLIMIETSKIPPNHKPKDFAVQISAYKNADNPTFNDVICHEMNSQELTKKSDCDTLTTRVDGGTLSQIERDAFKAQAAYSNAKSGTTSISITEQLKKYKEDQLLSKPGGDYFYLDKDTSTIDYHADQSEFIHRVGKDLKDAADNVVNILKDVGMGATMKYVDKDGRIQEAKKVGFIGTLANFFKDAASGVTLGKYTPDGEKSPNTALDTTKHFFKKVFVDALFKDVIVGIPRSAVHVAEDVAFAAINLAEAVPDATIGNSRIGQKITTEVFDDTQVLVDFVTDVIPTGEASSRTRAFSFKKGIKGLPLVHNITEPEKKAESEGGKKDENWKYVRNTPFRKTIESVASLIPTHI